MRPHNLYDRAVFEALVSKEEDEVKIVECIRHTLDRSQIFSERSSDAVARYLNTKDSVECLIEHIKNEPSASRDRNIRDTLTMIKFFIANCFNKFC